MIYYFSVSMNVFFFFLTAETRCNFEAVPNSYPRYLDKVVAAVNDDMDCERRCFGSKDFICRSFSYYSTQSQCFLSGDDRGKYMFI
jgi:hypothetical protein